MISSTFVLGWLIIGLWFPTNIYSSVNLFGSLKVQFYDGDNIILIQQGVKTKLHLACIDAPELEQAAGQRSRKALKAILDGQPFQYRVINKDRYGRLLSELKVGGLDVNRQMVAQGNAFYVNPSGKGCEGFAEAEAQAKENHLGVWQTQLQREPPPRQFRRSR